MSDTSPVFNRSLIALETHLSLDGVQFYVRRLGFTARGFAGDSGFVKSEFIALVLFILNKEDEPQQATA